jgi:hypothetical protein
VYQVGFVIFSEIIIEIETSHGSNKDLQVVALPCFTHTANEIRSRERTDGMNRQKMKELSKSTVNYWIALRDPWEGKHAHSNDNENL